MKRFEIGRNLQYMIMYIAMLIFFLLLSVISEAQTVTLPTWLADSAIYEIKSGRQCGIALEAIQAENKALGEELLHTGTALELSQRSNETLSALLNNARDYSGILTQQFTLDKNKLKAKIKRLWIWVTTEGVVIVVLIILL